jgi:hypothetical protein
VDLLLWKLGGAREIFCYVSNRKRAVSNTVVRQVWKNVLTKAPSTAKRKDCLPIQFTTVEETLFAEIRIDVDKRLAPRRG